jgi:ribosomal protein S10
MKTFNLIVTSKNKNSIKNFCNFFHEITYTYFRILRKTFKKQTKKKFITILTSPHVNKTAQEQFELKTFSTQIKLETGQPFKFLMLLKKIKVYIFPDVNIKLKLITYKVKQGLLKKKVFDIDNFKINRFQKFNNKNIKLNEIKFYKNNNFLYLFDIYGT